MDDKKQTLLINTVGLPQFETIDEFSEILRLSPRLLHCLSNNSNKFYHFVEILKRNGSFRLISIPSYTLMIVQKWILVNILNKVKSSESSMAFRKGWEYGHKQNAFYHAHTLYGLTLDLKEFFPSISANKVYNVFKNIGYNNFAATILTNLCTINGKLPQGASTSPALSNLVCITLDRRLLGLCKKRGIRYTRYADDMYFSCDDKNLLNKIYPIVKEIIEEEGFEINEMKTHFQSPSNKKLITGITIHNTNKNDEYELKAPRQIKRKIRVEIYKSMISGNYENKKHILGEIEYVAFIEKENKISYIERVKRYIDDIATKICYYPELVDLYNENKFFKDSKNAIFKKFEFKDDEDIDILICELRERKAFLGKHKLQDICKYYDIPDIILNEIDYVCS